MQTRALTANLEDYWNRMALAEDKLWLMYVNLRFSLDPAAKLCQKKALELSDRYHERFNPTLYRLEK